MLAYLLGLIAGICTPMQTSINNRLRGKVRSPYITSLISFGVAAVLVLIFLVITQGGVSIPIDTINEQPFWIWTGGIMGVLIVVPTTIALPHIGSARMVMLLSFGQIMTSLIVDHWGLFGSLQISFGISRALGAAVVIVGVAKLAGFSTKSGKAGGRNADCPDEIGGTFIYGLLSFISGVACSVQVAINGTLGSVINNPWVATFISMTIGTLVTAIIVIALYIFSRRTLFDELSSGEKFKPWMMLGGVMAFVLVGSNSMAAPIIGTGLVTIMNLVGQMGMSLVIDATGFLGIDKQAITKNKIIGMLLMIIGAAVITATGTSLLTA